ncbi:MAG: hypothetical protein E7183_05405 [Erysipelotrichaceae bacterium]|nr:hypothetical protein [Erysipelotrichaceae bacterium]
MKRNKNNKTNEYIDDGHTIYDMNVDASWNNRKDKTPSVMVSKEERRMLVKAAFLAYIPKLLLVIGCFLLALVLIYLWLKF